ncbi:hypothetical protein [uncultured Eubacterium sp.]|uniref:hypothetical protein n=1 Tax=uncultured Eubacterium sp. TaxID=165185 RepID=UPI0015BC01FA|nr:hypothetical protein [uncultured Eubacterium sp.]
MKNIKSDDLANAVGNSKINIDELKRAVESGKAEQYIDKNLSAEASQMIKQVLSDKKATQKIIQSPQAKALLEKLNQK